MGFQLPTSTGDRWISEPSTVPRDPGSPSENGSMEPKYLAFRRWLYTPIIIWQGDWIPRE